MPRTQADSKRDRAEEIVRVLEDFIDTLIRAQHTPVASVLDEYRENLTEKIEAML